jgi:hypothetical protein
MAGVQSKGVEWDQLAGRNAEIPYDPGQAKQSSEKTK